LMVRFIKYCSIPSLNIALTGGQMSPRMGLIHFFFGCCAALVPGSERINHF